VIRAKFRNLIVKRISFRKRRRERIRIRNRMRYISRVEIARIMFLDRLLNLVRDEFGGGCAGDSIEIKIKIIVGTPGVLSPARLRLF